jgi:uncharacterized damage-inducible protein DinB
MLEAFQQLARYNRWINTRLDAHVATLTDAERRADRGAYFESIHGTLNHLILADRLWITHGSNQSLMPAVPEALRLDDIERLDAELYAEFEDGQVTTLLMQAGIDPGVTDIVALPPVDSVRDCPRTSAARTGP